MLFVSNYGARNLVDAWARHNKTGIYPYPGGYLEQTAFCIEVFDFLTEKYNNYNNKLDSSSAKAASSNQSKPTKRTKK